MILSSVVERAHWHIPRRGQHFLDKKMDWRKSAVSDEQIRFSPEWGLLEYELPVPNECGASFPAELGGNFR